MCVSMCFVCILSVCIAVVLYSVYIYIYVCVQMKLSIAHEFDFSSQQLRRIAARISSETPWCLVPGLVGRNGIGILMGEFPYQVACWGELIQSVLICFYAFFGISIYIYIHIHICYIHNYIHGIYIYIYNLVQWSIHKDRPIMIT